MHELKTPFMGLEFRGPLSSTYGPLVGDNRWWVEDETGIAEAGDEVGIMKTQFWNVEIRE